jgi:hypothetical protein
LIGVDVAAGTSFGIGERKVVMSADYLTNASHQNYDVSPDGSEFLMIRRGGEEVHTILVHNWIRELMAKTAAKK